MKRKRDDGLITAFTTSKKTKVTADDHLVKLKEMYSMEFRPESTFQPLSFRSFFPHAHFS